MVYLNGMLMQLLKGASLVLCLSLSKAWAEPVLIADLSQPGAAQTWQVITDQVMGGLSHGGAVVQAGALRLTGTVTTANNGGFVQARRDNTGLPATTTALKIEVQGNGQIYYIHLRTTDTRLPWQYYQAAFTAPRDRTWVTLPLDSFRPSGRFATSPPRAGQVRSLALAAFGRDHTADVALYRVRAIVKDP